MSDQEIGKKMVEEMQFEHFQRAYYLVTGIELSIVSSQESPDFICERPYGTEIGVEVAEIRRDPRDAFNEQVTFKTDHMDPDEANGEIYRIIEQKEEKRQKNYGEWASNTILVLLLPECSIPDLEQYLFEDDYKDYGFVEIWLVDLTGRDSKDNLKVTLFALKSSKGWGYHHDIYARG